MTRPEPKVHPLPALRAAYSTRGGDVVHASEWGHVALCGAAVRDTGEPWTDETTHKCRRCLAKLARLAPEVA